MDKMKPPESQELQSESKATEGNIKCSECFSGQQVNINATDATAVNIVLRANKTAVVGNNTQVTICERCLLCQQRV